MAIFCRTDFFRSKRTNKERCQLRDKISARNYHVRRQGGIAKRIRLLDAIGFKLGSTQSENLALHQEIAALKKVLLDGRGAADLCSLNLPSPAPLPVGPGAIIAATAVSPPSLAPVTAEGMVSSPPGTPVPTTGTTATASITLSVLAPTPSGPPPPHSLRKTSLLHLHSDAILGLLGRLAGDGGAPTVVSVERSMTTNINPLRNTIGSGVTGKARLITVIRALEKENRPAGVVVAGAQIWDTVLWEVDKFPVENCWGTSPGPDLPLTQIILTKAATMFNAIRAGSAFIESILTFVRFIMTYQNTRAAGSTVHERISHMKAFNPLLYVFYRDGTLFFIPVLVLAIVNVISWFVGFPPTFGSFVFVNTNLWSIWLYVFYGMTAGVLLATVSIWDNISWAIDRFPVENCWVGGPGSDPPLSEIILIKAITIFDGIQGGSALVESILTFVQFIMMYQATLAAGSTVNERMSHIKTITPLLYVFYQDGTLFFIPVLVFASADIIVQSGILPLTIGSFVLSSTDAMMIWLYVFYGMTNQPTMEAGGGVCRPYRLPRQGICKARDCPHECRGYNENCADGQREPDWASLPCVCICGHEYHQHFLSPEHYNDTHLGPDLKGECITTGCTKFFGVPDAPVNMMSHCICTACWASHEDMDSEATPITSQGSHAVSAQPPPTTQLPPSQPRVYTAPSLVLFPSASGPMLPFSFVQSNPLPNPLAPFIGRTVNEDRLASAEHNGISRSSRRGGRHSDPGPGAAPSQTASDLVRFWVVWFTFGFTAPLDGSGNLTSKLQISQNGGFSAGDSSCCVVE
ncbi:hypothetical protein NP233_g8642 [Leucocoprinus birnbaumii]|uniref:Uncharacterized protein n=1 Tax=Leucocoprinus birnbaumii TaxID=56174 RepID=A0AAD5VM61_9AGAR|nr:hypothetical protein NP233_g8642 [Leucocoprinus birnbaumii]